MVEWGMKYWLSLLLLVVPGVVGKVRQDAPSKATPNIVLILADDLGYGDLSSYGSDFFRTPHLDQLAKQGMRFTDAYANSPNCAPTRAALLSGQYAPRTGIYTVNSSERGPVAERVLVPTKNQRSLEPSVVTLAEAIRDAGYKTAHMGKWHLGEGAETGPLGQGFDVNLAGTQRGHPASYFSPYSNPELSDGPDGEYLTERLTSEAIGFIESNQAQPFFLYLPYYTVHTPIQPNGDDLVRMEDREPGQVHTNPRYGAMVEGMDAQIGRILVALDRLKLTENTIVVFASDNGGKSPETDMLPLRGSKGMLYEGGIRVPFIVRWPGVTTAATESHEPVLTFDLYPTLVAAAGGKLPKDTPIDGRDLAPVLADSTANLDREAIYWHFPAYLHGYKSMSEEGPRPGWRATPSSAMRAGEWKLIQSFETDTFELYNLAEDPGEQTNQAEARPEVLKRLKAQLEAWQHATGAPAEFTPNPDYES